MSSDITNLQGERWHAPGWVFRKILDKTAEILRQNYSLELARLITNEEDYVRATENFYLSNLSNEDYRTLFLALQKAYHQFETEGSHNWYKPEFFPGFMDRFKELLEILQKDFSD